MMKKIMFVAFALLVASSFAAKKVKSKLGDVELTKEKDGGSVVLTVLKEGDTEVLVKGSCGQGWVPKSKVEYVAQKAGDKSMKLEDVDIVGWLDNPSAVFVLENDDIDFDGVNIDRDFKEYLQHTMDREQIEIRNNEN